MTTMLDLENIVLGIPLLFPKKSPSLNNTSQSEYASSSKTNDAIEKLNSDQETFGGVI